MEKKKTLVSAVVVLLVVIGLFMFNYSKENQANATNNTASDNKSEAYSSENLQANNSEAATVSDLKNTNNFAKGSLMHIFEGELNGRGNAVGYHTESLEDTAGEVIEGTRKKPNSEGVYSAKVMVSGVKKASNGGYSTFFPKEWTAQQVVDSINEAYKDKEWDNGNTYLGSTDDGVVIQMYLDSREKIISAFPVY